MNLFFDKIQELGDMKEKMRQGMEEEFREQQTQKIEFQIQILNSQKYFSFPCFNNHFFKTRLDLAKQSLEKKNFQKVF